MLRQKNKKIVSLVACCAMSLVFASASLASDAGEFDLSTPEGKEAKFRARTEGFDLNTTEGQEAFFSSFFEMDAAFTPLMSENDRPLIIATVVDGYWQFEIRPTDVSSLWGEDDIIRIVDFDFLDIQNFGNRIVVSGSEEKYRVAALLRLEILNVTMGSSRYLYINMSKEAERPTFTSYGTARLFINSITRRFNTAEDVIIYNPPLPEWIVEKFARFRTPTRQMPTDFVFVPKGERDYSTQPEIQRTMHDTTYRFFKAELNEHGQWIAIVNPRAAHRDWVTGSTTYARFAASLIESNFDYENDVLILSIDEDRVFVGQTLIVTLIRDNNPEDCGSVFINISDTDVFVFPSEEQAFMYGVLDANLFEVRHIEQLQRRPRPTNTPNCVIE